MSYDGFININKSVGGSSQRAVSMIKWLLKEKAGHCGTLDPMAGGVLPVCVGKATRLADFVMHGAKTYTGTVCLGIGTDSYDTAGDITEKKDASFITEEAVKAVLPDFIGNIMQTAPAISAIKKDGVPLYKRARRGEEVKPPCRKVHIDDIRLVDFIPGEKAYASIEVDCGHGVYIRSLAHDIGQALGVPAHLSALRRDRCGKFLLERAYTIEQVEEMFSRGDMSFLRPMEQEIDFLPALIADDKQMNEVSHGHDMPCPMEIAVGQTVRVMDERGKLLALGKAHEDSKGMLKINKVFISANDQMVCAIGNFDGLHAGHRALLEELYRQKKEKKCRSGVVTFSPHPLKLIRGWAPPLINSEELKNYLLKEVFDVDKVFALDFDEQMMNSTPAEFVENIIINKLKATSLVVGYNFTFAKDGQGTAQMLKELCAPYGIEVVIIGKVENKYGTVSSTAIRKFLAAGDMAAVNKMLGYWFVMEGQVITGNRIGRTIGFPTANFHPQKNQALPPTGVYAVRIEHNGLTYDGVANFGYKPTIGGENEPLVEAFLFDADIDLYGEDIRVWFGAFLRAEKRFSGLEELTDEIAVNCRQAREFLSGITPNKHLPKSFR